MKTYSKTRTLFASLSILLIASACTYSPVKKNIKMDSLVTTEWLSQHLNDTDLVVLDTTVLVQADKDGKFSQISGRDKFLEGHIPSAGFADLIDDLSATNSSMSFIMPTPQKFQAAISELGIDNNSRVVLYSQNMQLWPARLWWMFRWAGFDQVALLDGGFKAWKAEGRAVSTDIIEREAKKFTVHLRKETIADRDEVFTAISDSDTTIIDALPEAHFKGGFALYQRPGHIPGALNFPSSNLMQDADYFKPHDELEMMYDNARSLRTITYCGGGVAASANAFTLVRLGFTDVAVYMGSLQEWTQNPKNPMTID